MATIAHLFTLIRSLAADRARLALENVALRQQLIVLKRSATRAKITDSDRAFWVLMTRLLRDWKEFLLIVKPETVNRWQGFAPGARALRARRGWR